MTRTATLPAASRDTAPPAGRLEPAERALLLQYIEDETAVQRQLLAFLRDQERCLVAQDARALQAGLQEARPVIARLEEVTRRRARVLASLARRHGLEPGTVRLRDLVRLAGEGAEEALREACSALAGVACRIGTQNRRNSVLVRSGLETQRALVHALLGADASPRTYDRSARPRDPAPVHPVLDKEL